MLTDLEPHLPFLNFTKSTEFLPCSHCVFPSQVQIPPSANPCFLFPC